MQWRVLAQHDGPRRLYRSQAQRHVLGRRQRRLGQGKRRCSPSALLEEALDIPVARQTMSHTRPTRRRSRTENRADPQDRAHWFDKHPGLLQLKSHLVIFGKAILKVIVGQRSSKVSAVTDLKLERAKL